MIGWGLVLCCFFPALCKKASLSGKASGILVCFWKDLGVSWVVIPFAMSFESEKSLWHRSLH